ncbi:MAG: SRPBCC family protein [Myxococcota bacterium]|nr:SRPBCC family protein [Myxococcota bacterium]
MIRATAWFLSLIFSLVLAETGTAARPDTPHPHQGVVRPFDGKPEMAPPSEAQLESLSRGETILVTIEGEDGGRGMAIQDIQAPPEAVWDRIAAFHDYPQMVPYVTECEPYFEDGSDVRVRFVLKLLAIRYEYYIRHDFRPERGYVTWTLDYSKESDLDDSVGFWAVEEHPEDPDRSRLFYSIELRTRGWMPGFVRNMVARQGLKGATEWVKREAEALQARPDEVASPNARTQFD